MRMYYCTKCGAALTPGTQFCEQCGKQLEAPIPATHSVQKKRTATWVKVVGGLFLVFLFLMTWLSLSYSNLEEPVIQQLNAIKKGDISKAYYDYTSDGFQKATSLEEFRKFVKNYSVLHQNVTAKFDKPQVDQNDGGLLRAVLTAKNGDEAAAEYILSRDDDGWKIHSMRVEATLDYGKDDVAKGIVSPREIQAVLLPITKQLNDLKRGQVTSAYNGVSDAFKKATSMEQFEEFLEQFPALSMHTKVNFSEKAIHGERAAVQVMLKTAAGEVPVQYFLIKEGNQWRVWSLQIQAPEPQQLVEKGQLDLMSVPIKNQLKQLKTENVHDAYYENVSDEFKRISPYSTFEAFVKRFDILKYHSQVEYKQPRMEDSLGKLSVILQRGDGSKAILDYTLGYEDGIWKIRGLHLSSGRTPIKNTKIKKIAASDSFDEEALEGVAKEQLRAIQENDWEEAYDVFTAEQFKRATSIDVFKQFIRSHPFFKEAEDLNFSKLMFNNNIATLKGEITDTSGQKVPLEYDFIMQGDQWKVLRIHVDTEKFAESDTELRFPKIVVGYEIDARGMVIDERSSFAKRDKRIYANVYVQNGIKGDEITVIFKHLLSGSAIAPVKTQLPNDGLTIASFVFNPPPQGWPKGKYQLEISSSRGADEYYVFEVK